MRILGFRYMGDALFCALIVSSVRLLFLDWLCATLADIYYGMFYIYSNAVFGSTGSMYRY